MQKYRSCLAHAATSFAHQSGVEAGHDHAVTYVQPEAFLAGRHARVTRRTVGAGFGYAY